MFRGKKILSEILGGGLLFLPALLLAGCGPSAFAQTHPATQPPAATPDVNLYTGSPYTALVYDLLAIEKGDSKQAQKWGLTNISQDTLRQAVAQSGKDQFVTAVSGGPCNGSNFSFSNPDVRMEFSTDKGKTVNLFTQFDVTYQRADCPANASQTVKLTQHGIVLQFILNSTPDPQEGAEQVDWHIKSVEVPQGLPPVQIV